MDELKTIISFGIGIGIGVVATKAYFKNKYEQIANDEIESIKNTYKDKTPVYDPDEQNTNTDISDECKVISSIDYSILADRADLEHPEDDKSTDVYEITEEDYSETELGYDKCVLNYYVDDGILFDPYDKEGVVTEYSTIGEDNVRLIAESTNTYSMFFRDDNFGKDYEVVKVSGAYSEGV